MSEPTTLRAGDSATWTVSKAGHPANAGWALAYRLIPVAAGTPIVFDAVAAGADFTVTLAAATTAAWAAGAYRLVAVLSKGAEQATQDLGALTVLPNLATATSGDFRSEAARTLATLQSLYATACADGSVLTQEYQIAGRMRRFRTTADILAAIDFWQRQVAKEQAAAAIAAGVSPGRGRIQVRL